MNIGEALFLVLLYVWLGLCTISVVYNRWDLYYKTPLWEGLIFIFWPLVLLYALTLGLIIEWIISVIHWYKCEWEFKRRKRK